MMIEEIKSLFLYREANEDRKILGEYAQPVMYGYYNYVCRLLEWMSKEGNYVLVENMINTSWDELANDLIVVIQETYARNWINHYFKVLEVVKSFS